MNLVLNHHWFKNNEFETDKRFREETQKKLTKEKNKKLLCKYCENHITNTDDAIFVEGHHSHTFTNPAGYIYTINCYQVAPGCSISGERTNEFSWFKGYDWQIALCGSCREQLGWLFTNERRFFALISDRLIPEF
jgi:hypothetical protein